MKIIFLTTDKKCKVFRVDGEENFFERSKGIYVISPRAIAQTVKKPFKIGFYRPNGDQVFEFKLRRKIGPQAIYFDNNASPLPFSKIEKDNETQIKDQDLEGESYYKPPKNDLSWGYQESFITQNALRQLAGLSGWLGLKQFFKSVFKVLNLRNIVLMIIMLSLAYSYLQGEFLI